MSLSWLERARLGLCPERIVLRRRGKEQAHRVTPLEGAPAWRAAVDALPGALGERAPRRLDVILSHHFVRYALLPWSEALRTEAAWLAYARHRLAELHGAPLEGWALRVSASAPRGARIACATEQALLDALRGKLAQRGVRATSVQPHLMAAFNRERRALRGASCWLVVEEAGRLALACFERGAWTALRVRRAGARRSEALPLLLQRESALLGRERPLPAHRASVLA